MFYFPDPDTGYCDEPDDGDAGLEAQLADEEDRFEYEAQEMHERLWEGPLVRCADDSPITLPPRRVIRINNQHEEVA